MRVLSRARAHYTHTCYVKYLLFARDFRLEFKFNFGCGLAGSLVLLPDVYFVYTAILPSHLRTTPLPCASLREHTLAHGQLIHRYQFQLSQ